MGIDGLEERLIGTFATRMGLPVTTADRAALADTVRRLVEQVRIADAEFEGDDPFPAYLT